ncbi:hypothetical protein AC578_5445, partial [Pseudocercospora eumusae]
TENASSLRLAFLPLGQCVLIPATHLTYIPVRPLLQSSFQPTFTTHTALQPVMTLLEAHARNVDRCRGCVLVTRALQPLQGTFEAEQVKNPFKYSIVTPYLSIARTWLLFYLTSFDQPSEGAAFYASVAASCWSSAVSSHRQRENIDLLRRCANTIVQMLLHPFARTVDLRIRLL